MHTSWMPLVLLAVLIGGQDHAFAELKIGGVAVTRADQATFNALTNNGNDALRVEIFDKMVASTESFPFTNTNHAAEHFTVRQKTVEAINSMSNGGGIDYSYGFQFPAGLRSVDKKARNFRFEIDPAGTITKTSDALKAVETGTTRAECVTALDCSILIGHRRTLGDAWIDGKIPAANFRADESFHFVQGTTDTATVIPGDFRYMINKSDYLEKARKNGKANPLWQGENTIYVGGNKYTGLGLQNRSETQLRGDLRSGYTADTGITLTDAEANANIVFKNPFRIKIH